MQPSYFRIKRHFSIVAHSADHVELRYGVWNPVSFTLTDDTRSGRLYSLISRLDGSCSPAHLAEAEGVPLEQVEELIEHLQELDLVETGASSSLDYYLDNIVPILAPGSKNREVPLPVTLLGDPCCMEALAANLKQSMPGIDIMQVSESDPAWLTIAEADPGWLNNGRLFYERLAPFESWRGRLLIFVTRIINPIHSQMLNRIALELDIPWLHGAFDGPFLFVGPTFVPRRTACYECFESRLMINLRENAGYLRYKQALVNQRSKQGIVPVEGVVCGILTAHLAMEALNYILTGAAFTVNKTLAIYLPTMEFTFNEVLRVPGCEGCSPSSARDEEALYFDTRTLIQADLPTQRRHERT